MDTPARRQIGLGLVAFAATLLLIVGLLQVIGRAPAGVANGSGSPTATIRPSASPSAGSSASPGSSGSATPTATPAATPAASGTAGDPVLVGAGDIADCSTDDDQATANLIAGIAGTVFTAGDNAYESGSAAEFAACYAPTWGAFLDRTHPTAGNHDWETKDAAGYLGYFGTRADPKGKTWYSYDLGTWHVVVLDSDCGEVGGCGPDSAQGRWLASDLADSTARCTVAIWHHPRFSSGLHGNDKDVAPFWDALYAGGADLVINGHDHDYERFAPQDPSGHEDRTRGIREFVVGTGGAPLRSFVKEASNSELGASVTHGVLKLTLHPSSYEWTFVPSDTTTRFGDSGSGPCH